MTSGWRLSWRKRSKFGILVILMALSSWFSHLPSPHPIFMLNKGPRSYEDNRGEVETESRGGPSRSQRCSGVSREQTLVSGGVWGSGATTMVMDGDKPMLCQARCIQRSIRLHSKPGGATVSHSAEAETLERWCGLPASPAGTWHSHKP